MPTANARTLSELQAKQQRLKEWKDEIYSEWVHARNPARVAVLDRRAVTIERIQAIISLRMRKLSKVS